LIAVAPAAYGASFTQPASSPVAVQVDAKHHPVALTVAARGFPPGAQVFVEQCDGESPTTPHWDPSMACDLANAPSPVLADRNGAVVFSAKDSAHTFVPFVGAGPQGLFNCVGPGAPAPNSQPTFHNCQIRVATSINMPTSDQIFETLAFPAGAVAAPPPAPLTTTTLKPGQSGSRSVKSTTTTTTKRGGSTAKHGASTTLPTNHGLTHYAHSVSKAKLSVSLPGANSSSSSHGSSHSGTGFGLLLLALGAAIAGGVIWYSRRRIAGSGAAAGK
jgi:hypothetical protein